jgi:hypothetical protein
MLGTNKNDVLSRSVDKWGGGRGVRSWKRGRSGRVRQIDPQSKIQNPKSKIQNPKSKIEIIQNPWLV